MARLPDPPSQAQLPDWQLDCNLSAHQPTPIHFSSGEMGWGCPWSGAILRERSLEKSPAWQEMDGVVQPQKQERRCHGGSES